MMLGIKSMNDDINKGPVTPVVKKDAESLE
jgi:hypothetical protein